MAVRIGGDDGVRGRLAEGIDALRGAIGFLSRVPVGRDERAWTAFVASPTVFPLVGYFVGGLLALALLLPLPAPTVALVFLAWVYVVTGINHLDGVADVGDAMVVHGDPERRREVARDTTTGVGALLAVGVVLAGIALAGVALAGLPARATAIVVAAEVGAKFGIVLVAGFGTASHEGLGSQITSRVGPRSTAVPAIAALPALGLAWPNPAPVATLLAAVVASLSVLWWARSHMGGVGGDVLGATNEVSRLAGLHAGVIAWTLW